MDKITLMDRVRFWRRVDRRSEEECWIIGPGKTGYGGVITDASIRWAAHRFAWRITYGIIDPCDLHVLHRCDIRRCVNPKHLFLGTNADNVKDKVSKGRHRSLKQRFATPRGEEHPHSKLTASQVEEIRRRYVPGEITQQQLAIEYGVTQANISLILLGYSRQYG